jgi:hypothetical protein
MLSLSGLEVYLLVNYIQRTLLDFLVDPADIFSQDAQGDKLDSDDEKNCGKNRGPSGCGVLRKKDPADYAVEHVVAAWHELPVHDHKLEAYATVPRQRHYALPYLPLPVQETPFGSVKLAVPATIVNRQSLYSFFNN